MTNLVIAGWQRVSVQGRNVLVMMSGTTVAQGIGIASTLVLARLYAPEEFGAYAFFFTIAVLFSVVSSLKYDQAVFLARSSREATEIAALAIVVTLLVSVMGTVVIGLCVAIWNASEPARILDGKLIFLAMAIANGGCLVALQVLCIQRQKFAVVARSRIAQSFVAAGMGIGCGLSGFGVLGLILGFLGGQLAGILLLRGEFLPLHRARLGRRLLAHARRHLRFPKFMVAADLFNNAGYNLLALSIPMFFGTAALGQYNLGQRAASLPISVIGTAIGEVFRGRISPQHASASEVRRIFFKTSLVLAVIGACLSLPILLFGPALFEIVLGSQWRDAGLYMQILSPLIFARFIVNPLSAVLVLAGWQRIDAMLQIMFIAAASFAIAFGVANQSMTWALIALSAGQCAVYGLYFAVSLMASRRIAKI